MSASVAYLWRNSDANTEGDVPMTSSPTDLTRLMAPARRWLVVVKFDSAWGLFRGQTHGVKMPASASFVDGLITLTLTAGV